MQMFDSPFVSTQISSNSNSIRLDSRQSQSTTGVWRVAEALHSCFRELREWLNELKLSLLLPLGPKAISWSNVAFAEFEMSMCVCKCGLASVCVCVCRSYKLRQNWSDADSALGTIIISLHYRWRSFPLNRGSSTPCHQVQVQTQRNPQRINKSQINCWL